MWKDWQGQREGDPHIHHNFELHEKEAESMNSEECCLVRNCNSYIHTGYSVNKMCFKVLSTDCGMFVMQSASPWIQRARSWTTRVQYYTAPAT